MTPTELREALARLDLTQSEAARRMYCHRLKVWRWYHGVTRIPGEITALLECWEQAKKG